MSLWSFQLDEALLGSVWLHLCMKQLHNKDLNIKKGKISKASSKRTHVVVPTTIILSGVCVYAHKHTL